MQSGCDSWIRTVTAAPAVSTIIVGEVLGVKLRPYFIRTISPISQLREGKSLLDLKDADTRRVRPPMMHVNGDSLEFSARFQVYRDRRLEP